jgi:hypothetical protein
MPNTAVRLSNTDCTLQMFARRHNLEPPFVQPLRQGSAVDSAPRAIDQVYCTEYITAVFRALYLHLNLHKPLPAASSRFGHN